MRYKRLLLTGLILLALGAGLSAVLRSESVFVWLFHQAVKLAPGELTVEALGGRLAGPISLRGLRYRQGETLIYIGDLELDWRPGRLLQGRLDISRLQVDGLDIQLPAAEGAAGEPPELLVPPVQISLEQAHLRQIRVLHDTEVFLQIQKLALQARTEYQALDIVSLQVELDSARLALAGRLGLAAPFPLELSSDWRWQAPGMAALAGRGELRGDLQQLQLSQTLLQPSTARLSGVIQQPLQRLRWQGQLEVEASRLSQWLETNSELQLGGSLQGQGDLQQFSLQGRVQASEPLLGDLHSELQGRYGAQALHIDKLLLQRKGSEASVSLRGAIALTETPSADLQGEWQNLAWPLSGPAQVLSKKGAYTLQGTLQDYRLKAEASVQGPAVPDGRWQVAGRGHGDGLKLETIQGRVLDGQLSGELELSWAPQLRWQLTLNGKQLDPATFWPVQHGRLALGLRSQGQIKDGVYQAEARVDELRGTLHKQPVKGRLQLAIKGSHYQVPRLEVSIGASRLQAHGELAQHWDLHWQAHSDDLQIFSPLARGRLDTEGQVSGPRATPRIQGTIAADEMAVGDFGVKQVRTDLDVDLAAERPSRLHALASQARYAEQVLDSIEVRLTSLAENLSLEVQAQGQAMKLDLQASGPFQVGRWQGMINKANFETPRLARWQLQAPATFVLASGKMRLDGACWNAAEARLCVGAEQVAADEWRLNVSAKQVPLALGEGFIPDNLRLNGTLQGEAALVLKGPQLSGRADWVFSAGSIVYTPQQDKPISMAYRGGRLQLRQDAAGLNGELGLEIDAASHIRLAFGLPRLGLDTRSLAPEQAITLHLQARLEQLALLGLIFPELMTIQGGFSADLRLAGSYGRPRIQGYARLEHVQTALPDLGITLQDLTLSATADDGSQLNLKGQVRSGGGELHISGTWQVDPAAGWPLQLSVQGERFEIIQTPELKALVSPKLKLRVAGNRIDVEGSVLIPQARLEPVALPEGVTVSRDVVIVGTDVREDASRYKTWLIYSRVRIILGEEVYFNGFGLRGRLTGEVLAVDSPQTLTTGRGELVIHDGRYRVHGENLEVDPGRLVFAGGPIDDPGVDARAVRRLDEVVAGVQVRGTLKAPKLTLFSEPAMRDSDILAYIVLGRPLDQATGSEAALLVGVSSLLNFTGSRGINDQIASRFGLEEISLKPGTGTGEGVSLVLGKYLSPKLYISYMIGLADTASTVRARYKVSRRVSLQGESSSTQSGADVLYTIER